MRYRTVQECLDCRDWVYYDKDLSEVCSNCNSTNTVVTRVVE